MRKQVSFGVCALTFFSLAAPIRAQLWSGVISPSRAVDWSSAGSSAVAAEVSWTQCGSTIAAGASYSTINAAISSCGTNQYVQLGPGTFNLAGGLLWNHKSNVALRGMGANQTFLVFTNSNPCQGLSGDVCFQSSDVNYAGGPSNVTNWTAGYTKGTTSITLSSNANLAIGTPITLDQTDDTTDGGSIYVCFTPQGVCSTNGDSGGAPRSGRSQQQIVTVTSISGSGPYTVGISPGIYMPNWISAKTPQAWWPTSPIFNAGIENLSMNHSAAEPTAGNGVGVVMFNCVGCWVKGVRSIDPGRSHVMMFQSSHCTVQDSYFFETAGTTSSSYGVESFPASNSLIQNNIFQQISGPVAFNGTCSGCVQGYNFDINDIFGSGGVFNWEIHSSAPHAVGDENILVEGNQGVGMDSDIIHGSHHFITAFRNAWNGYQLNNGMLSTGNAVAIIVRSYNRFFNIIGNVLGSPGSSNSYNQNSPDSIAIYSIGVGDQTPNDPITASTLMRWGNYDTVTAATRFCGNSSNSGWSTTCASTSEVPSGIANYANPVPSTTTLAASFYLSSQPSWWPSSKPWPPIGPDVSGGNLGMCSGGTNAGIWATSSSQCTGGSLGTAYAGHVNSIPAMDCYLNTMGGSPQGTGNVLTFNAEACYSSVPVTTTANPPTNLTAVAH